MTAATAEIKRRKNVASEITGIVADLEKAILDDRRTRVALSTTLAIHKRRIFEEGKAANGSEIGKYSTKPASISKKKQARQTGHTYFPGGYSQYKKEVGKNPGKVILRDSDQMYTDYGLRGSAGDYGFGFQNDFNTDKSVWNEDHFNKDIFQLSEQEMEVFTNTYNAQL